MTLTAPSISLSSDNVVSVASRFEAHKSWAVGWPTVRCSSGVLRPVLPVLLRQQAALPASFLYARHRKSSRPSSLKNVCADILFSRKYTAGIRHTLCCYAVLYSTFDHNSNLLLQPAVARTPAHSA